MDTLVCLTSMPVLSPLVAKHFSKSGRSPQKKTRRGMSVCTLTNSSAPLYNLLAPYHLRRRMADVSVVSTGVGGLIQPFLPPSWTGISPVTIGTPFAESYPGLGNMQAVPFALTARFGALPEHSDFQAVFQEYRFLGVEVEVQFMAGGAYAPTIGSPIPELLIASEPANETFFATVEEAEGRSDALRVVLSPEKTFKRWTQPSPAIAMYENGLSTAYARPASNQSMWLSTTDFDTPHYMFKGFLRNFPLLPDTGCMVRFSFVAHIELRRPF
jgi:hypothetical protein